MARLTLRPNNSCFFSHTPFTRTTSFQRFHFHLSPSNHTLRLRLRLRLSRIVSSAHQNAKETQRVSMAKAKARFSRTIKWKRWRSSMRPCLGTGHLGRIFPKDTSSSAPHHWPSLFVTWISEELNLNLTEAAWVSILPPLASIFVTSLAAQLADNLISRGVETTVVRKICQSIAFLSPAICMTLSSLDLGLPPWEIVGILTSGLALSSFALSGLYCTHQDMSPEYAKGITNNVGAVPGIVGVALTGYLLDSTHSWSISLFAPSIFFYVTGTIIWLAFASRMPQSFSEQN